MAVVLIEGHEVHRHVGCISNEARVEQLHWPKVAVLIKQIESVGDVLGGGVSSTVPVSGQNEGQSKLAMWR